MATGGWGAMGGGAWGGSKPQPPPPDVEGAEAPASHASPAPLYGGPTGSSAPSQQQSAGFGGVFKGAFGKQQAVVPPPYQQQQPQQQQFFGGQGGAYAGTAAGGSVNAGSGNLSVRFWCSWVCLVLTGATFYTF